jgi:hypothetical protein
LSGQVTELAAGLGQLTIQAFALPDLHVEVGLQTSYAPIQLMQLVRGLLQLCAQLAQSLRIQ